MGGENQHAWSRQPQMPLQVAHPQFETALVWFRRDLRVDDNPALTAATNHARNVIPVYIFAPAEEGQFQPGRCSRWWLKGALSSLSRELSSLGSKLILRRGVESVTVLQQLIEETGATAVFYNHLYDPISLVRDNEAKAEMAAKNVSCFTFNSELLYEPWEITDDKGNPFTKFSEFWERVVNMSYPPQPVLATPCHLPAVSSAVVSLSDDRMALLSEEEEMSSEHLKFKWQPGSVGGISKLNDFLSTRLKNFDCDRAKTDRESTSRLSPYIHYGQISVRRIHVMVKQLEWQWASTGQGSTSCADFLRQMGYREYGRYLSFHFPFTHERSLLEHLRACPWNFDQSLFKAWRQGATGYPLIDAGMLELWSTGWLHNRLRVLCASFLVKNMLLPWQWGLKHFWDNLLDADVESDALGFQYVSGCLLDAHPFSFMHDIAEESRRFDPSGNYVRRWIPALSRMPFKYIHNPSMAPGNVLLEAGVELGINYPFPIISPEESTRQLNYACDVIARCCPNPPQYRKEPYYPPSDPRLDPESSNTPWQLPMHGEHESGKFNSPSQYVTESDVDSNSLGMSPSRPANSAVGTSHRSMAIRAEDDAAASFPLRCMDGDGLIQADCAKAGSDAWTAGGRGSGSATETCAKGGSSDGNHSYYTPKLHCSSLHHDSSSPGSRKRPAESEPEHGSD